MLKAIRRWAMSDPIDYGYTHTVYRPPLRKNRLVSWAKRRLARIVVPIR